MRSIKTNPTAIIGQIRNLLRDDYGPGFPILKELVQNADDAKASSLDLAFVGGLAAARHPLLIGPAVVVINDGKFDGGDEEKIALMGEGNKSDEISAIGSSCTRPTPARATSEANAGRSPISPMPHEASLRSENSGTVTPMRRGPEVRGRLAGGMPRRVAQSRGRWSAGAG